MRYIQYHAIQKGYDDIQKVRLQVFCLVNNINFALSEPLRRYTLRHDFIQKLLQDVLASYTTEQHKLDAVKALHALASGYPHDRHMSLHAVQLTWLNLLKGIKTRLPLFCV